jgi:hypothetical protein
MNIVRTFAFRLTSPVLALLFAAGLGSAAGQAKKPTPAPAKPAAVAAKPAATAAKPAAASSATHATTTTTTASHATTTTTAAHGATTTTAGHGATTTTAAHPTAAGGTAAHGGAPATAAHAGAPGAAGRPGAPAAGAHGGVAGVHNGNLAHAGPAGSHDRVSPNGNAMRVRANGRPSDFHDARRGMDVHNNLGGGRRVMMERPDHSRLYYERGRPGYIAHPYMFHGHEYARRTYYYNGRAYDRFYNHYAYRGVYLDVYAPVHYYGVGFYGWAYNPWAVPVAYAWGFRAAPWYGYYGAYFTPYPVYATPSLWLTDYLISQSLQASYEARMAAQAQADAVAGAAPPAPLTPETKAMIADEVRRQVALENAEAQANAQQKEVDASSSSIARILGDGQPHVFVAGKEIDLTDQNGQECAVTDGDVLQLKTPPPPDATTASLVVLSSKGGVECRNMSSVSVSFEDLQDMQNHMRETVDQGLQELQAKQGKDGLPPAPASALTPPTTAAIAENAPPPDPAGAKDLAAQAQEADKAEQEVQADVAGGAAGGGAAAPAAPTQTVTVSMGMSPDQVTGAVGQPTKILNLGPKVVYVYKDMKVTFKGGKVTDVE